MLEFYINKFQEIYFKIYLELNSKINIFYLNIDLVMQLQ